MSPSTLRRYRAERLLREEFGGLRGEVLGAVGGRLRARGVHLDGGDLEACYAQAWQGLYAAIAAGDEIANPRGWLTVVTYRRAIDEYRSARARRGPPERAAAAEWALSRRDRVERAAAQEPDLAAALDDRARLRQLFEALRSRLNARECEAASLCYLQGLTRAQAAERMGISEARMGKLMEGASGRPGVAGKVGELLETIRGGGWCEQQSSLMRGLAFGILDPRGERYRLARLHQRECPACRAYILSLRGLAAVLPPLPLPWGLGFGSPPTQAPHTTPTQAAGAKASAGASAGAGGGVGTGAGAGTASTAAGSGATSAGVGAGAISASGAAGVGGAGGGWVLSGSLGAKLAVSCVLALSVSCVALTVAPHHAGASARRGLHRKAPTGSAYTANTAAPVTGTTSPGGGLSRRSSTPAAHISRAALAIAARRASARQAQREFGPEQPSTAPGSSASTAPGSTAGAVSARARAASSTTRAAARQPRSGAASAEEPAAPTSADPPTHAEREFGPE